MSSVMIIVMKPSGAAGSTPPIRSGFDQRSWDCEIPWLETECRGPTRTPIACSSRESQENRI
jgi:hypothetical protein